MCRFSGVGQKHLQQLRQDAATGHEGVQKCGLPTASLQLALLFRSGRKTSRVEHGNRTSNQGRTSSSVLGETF